jgi:RNA polymerase sigma factor (TIGR02999 family)
MPPESSNPDLTSLLSAAGSGDAEAGAKLLPLIYDELHKLAAARMRKAPGFDTLQPTALVHEAYVRLVGRGDPGWNGRGHFFAAAARAMRDILVEQARRKAALKRGGDMRRVDALESTPTFETPREDLLALDDALRALETEDARKGEIVMLRYFAGLSQAETAAALGVSERTIEREWRYIRVWLRRQIDPGAAGSHP